MHNQIVRVINAILFIVVLELARSETMASEPTANSEPQVSFSTVVDWKNYVFHYSDKQQILRDYHNKAKFLSSMKTGSSLRYVKTNRLDQLFNSFETDREWTRMTSLNPIEVYRARIQLQKQLHEIEDEIDFLKGCILADSFGFAMPAEEILSRSPFIQTYYHDTKEFQKHKQLISSCLSEFLRVRAKVAFSKQSPNLVDINMLVAAARKIRPYATSPRWRDLWRPDGLRAPFDEKDAKTAEKELHTLAVSVLSMIERACPEPPPVRQGAVEDINEEKRIALEDAKLREIEMRIAEEVATAQYNTSQELSTLKDVFYQQIDEQRTQISDLESELKKQKRRVHKIESRMPY